MNAQVLFVIPTLKKLGGAERVFMSYVEHLKNCEPYIVCIFANDCREKCVHGRRCESLNVQNHWPLALQLLLGSYRLASLTRRQQFAGIVSFLTFANVISILAKFASKSKCKVIINVHDIMSNLVNYTKLKNYQKRLLFLFIRLLYRHADAIIAVCEGVKRDLVEYFGVPIDKVTVIHNPIDIEQIHRLAAEPVMDILDDNKNYYLIVAVGRLAKVKGFDILIQAVARLIKELDVRLIIIGDGEERSNLLRLTKELRVDGVVCFLGWQSNPWKYMARADVFVLSSLVEGFPNVIGEAMALGLPVLATNCSPGVRELLEDGKSGLLVPAGDPEALAEGIARVLSDEGLRQELAQRGRQRVAQFDLPKVIMLYEDVLLRLLHKGRHN